MDLDDMFGEFNPNQRKRKPESSVEEL
jgi:hypothetical protein